MSKPLNVFGFSVLDAAAEQVVDNEGRTVTLASLREEIELALDILQDNIDDRGEDALVIPQEPKQKRAKVSVKQKRR
jgi:hypothetical protein